MHVGGRGGEGREGDRLPGRDEGLVARPAAQERRRPRAGRRRRRPKEVRAAYDELLAQGARRPTASARIEGVLVCEMVTGGVEMLIGVSHDELFGPVVTVGLGGIFVEVFGDVTFRVPPFDDDEARRDARRARRATSCSKACAARSRPTSTRSST